MELRLRSPAPGATSRKGHNHRTTRTGISEIPTEQAAHVAPQLILSGRLDFSGCPTLARVLPLQPERGGGSIEVWRVPDEKDAQKDG